VGKVILNDALPATMLYLNSQDHLNEVNKDDILDKGTDPRKVIHD
jgi:hypothetical protein